MLVWLKVRRLANCIPPRRNRKIEIPHDKKLNTRWPRIEIMLVRLNDCRRIATRSDRCASAYLVVTTIAAMVIF